MPSKTAASLLAATAARIVHAACTRDRPGSAYRDGAAVTSASATSDAGSAPEATQFCVTPEAVEALPLDGASWRGHEAAAVAAVRKELRRLLEVPSEFHAAVHAASDVVVVELWHRSAFLPENCRTFGDAGGKSRTLTYDVRTRRIIGTKFR